MKSLTKEKRYDLIDAFNSTSRYLDDLLNIDNIHFEHMVRRIYPAELQLNKANASDTEAAFLDLHLSIHNDIVSTKIYDKRDDFNFDIVNFPFLDGDVPQPCRRNLVLTDLLAFPIDVLVVAQVYSGAPRHFFRSLTTAADNRYR